MNGHWKTLGGCLCSSLILIALVLFIWWLLTRREEESAASPSASGSPLSPGESLGERAEETVVAESEVAFAAEASPVGGGLPAPSGEGPSGEEESFAMKAKPVSEEPSAGWEAIQGEEGTPAEAAVPGGEETAGGWESLGEEESFAMKAEPVSEEPSAGWEAIQGEEGTPAEAAVPGGEGASGGWESLGEEESFAAQAEPVPSKPDDLKRIEGIGPKIAELLNAAGITTFAQLAQTDVETLRQILVKAGRRFALASPETWPEQAALAAKGDWDALKRLQDSLKGGRR